MNSNILDDIREQILIFSTTFVDDDIRVNSNILDDIQLNSNILDDIRVNSNILDDIRVNSNILDDIRVVLIFSRRRSSEFNILEQTGGRLRHRPSETLREQRAKMIRQRQNHRHHPQTDSGR